MVYTQTDDTLILMRFSRFQMSMRQSTKAIKRQLKGLNSSCSFMSLQNAWGFLGTETNDISNIRENMFTLNLIHGSTLLVNPGIFLFPQYYAQELRIF